jgi:hypothetical protein
MWLRREFPAVDSASLVRKLNNEGNESLEISSLIANIQGLRRLFEDINFKKISREAHEIAKLSRVGNCNWDLIQKDCNPNSILN